MSCKAEKTQENESGTVVQSSGNNESESANKQTSGENKEKKKEKEKRSSVETPTKNNEEVKISVIKSREKFSLGRTKESGYINESAGFRITGLDEKWKESKPQQISSLFNTGIDADTGKAYSLEESGGRRYMYDVFYTNVDTDEVISVSLLENDGKNGLSSDIPVNTPDDELDGFTHHSELIYLDFAGEKISCKKIQYSRKKNLIEVPDLTEYEIYMMPAGRNQILKIVIVCYDNKTKIEDMLKHFKPILK